MNTAEVDDAYLPRVAVEIAAYRRMLREYRKLLGCMGLEAAAVESILSASAEGGTIHRRELLRCLNVELDATKLELAGFRGAIAEEAREWFRTIRKVRS